MLVQQVAERAANQKVADPTREQSIRIKIQRPLDGSILVQISDNGIGMDAELQKRVFEPFFTTKPNDEGLGLGLPIASQAITRHGGSIEVESEFGVGSTITVSLPALGGGSV